MKKLIIQIVNEIVKNNFLWKVLKPFSSIGIIMADKRATFERNKKGKQKLEDFFKLKQVLNGPFKGMKYPGIHSVGSAILPKLLGSYEKEISVFFKNIKANEYTEIIDIGCAEGYYAVGLAMNTTTTKIYAFDTEEKAQMLCTEMANLNNVKDKVTVGATLTAEELAKFKFMGKALVICDCEGFEKELFNRNNIHNLSNCDLVIETHDFIDIEISTYLTDLFKDTHSIESIKSTDDIQKALHYQFDELKTTDLKRKLQILAEARPAIMEWLICKPKN